MGIISSRGGFEGRGKFAKNLKVAYFVAYSVLSLIVFRLWYLQGLHGTYYRNLSENNRIRTLKTTAARGSFFDRDGRLLVGNRPAFNVSLMLEDTPDVDKTLTSLSEILEIPRDELEARLASKKTRPFEPKILVRDVSREQLAKVKVNRFRLPGVIIDTAPTRMYPFDNLAVQLFGYAREVSKEELAKLSKNYKRGDIVGKAGLERSKEPDVRGESGYVQVEVDARGNRRRELGIKDSIPGEDLYLTIDLDLQLAAEAALAGRRGAVVAMEPKTGDILALASSPNYDGNIFSGEMALEDWRNISQNVDKPLNNRATTSIYPPGSTFKLLMAVAGLAEKLVTPKTVMDCPGYVKFGRRRYRCHKREGHGKVNLRDAIKMSCNAYFYRLGVSLGIERIEQYSKYFGLGSRIGLGVGKESNGIVPSKKWKLDYYGERWYPGDTIPVTIGQGYLSVTPLQMAFSIGALANDGTLYRPRLIKKAVNRITGEVEEFKAVPKDVIAVNKDIFKLVRSMAADVVNAEKGTGSRARFEEVRVAGKTGTAQVSSLGKESLGERLKDHAWFVSFAPEEDPMIAMAIIVENAGHGGVSAAPISKQVMEVFFRKKGMLTVEKDDEAKLASAPLVEEDPADG